jgi:alanine dehydrogenase
VHETTILNGSDIRLVLDIPATIDAVERSFRLSGAAIQSKVLGFHAAGGGFHIKAALLDNADRSGIFAAKLNANFPGNPAKGLPTIQGVLALFEAKSGRLLALMDSSAITLLRTAAASAVAARALARATDSRLAIIGCGAQAGPHLDAIKSVRDLEEVWVFDADEARASSFADRYSSSLLPVKRAASVEACVQESDIIVTCTSSRKPFLFPEHVAPGTFIAAVGADNEDKQELAPELMASASVYTDSLEQCAAFGDLHHAIEAGVMTRDSVRGNLADVLSEGVRGRSSNSETIVFDSTGVAFQDVVCAELAYVRAKERKLGLEVALSQ